MFPPLTDLVALAGIALVACATCLRLRGLTFDNRGQANAKGRWLASLCFVALWIPVGAAQLPVAAHIRGVTSDFSVSLVVLAAFDLSGRLFGLKPYKRRERQAAFHVIAAAALFLYPLALGWSDWDAYRLGWGSAGLWAGLFFLCVVGWVAGLRLLLLLIGLAMLSWVAQLMESTNLWDYLFDPWLATAAIFKSGAAAATQLRARFLHKKNVGNAIGEII